MKLRNSTYLLKQGESMKISLVAVALIAVLASCATPSTMFVGPNGNVVRCASAGFGYIGAPMAMNIQDRCINDVKNAGLLPIEEAGGIGIQISAEASSTRILQITPSSPADRAGMKAGDSIIAVNDQLVTNVADIRRLVFGRVNTPVKIAYRSGVAEKTVTINRSPISGVQLQQTENHDVQDTSSAPPAATQPGLTQPVTHSVPQHVPTQPAAYPPAQTQPSASQAVTAKPADIARMQTATPAPTSSTPQEENLRQLKRLNDAGLISQEIYLERQRKILEDTPPSPAASDGRPNRNLMVPNPLYR